MRGWGYAVFGKVVKGQEVVMKISKVDTGPRDPLPSDVPMESVVIEDVRVLP
jgi:cyclophilin family peptidyl-prolyl cis-trans isomerase